MQLWIQITSGSNIPIYLQITEQISEAIAKGQLREGDKLPAVRKLESELVVNPNTVARAYSALEQQGLVTTKTGAGTFIADPKLRDSDASDINILTTRMDNLITRGLNLGVNAEELIRIFENRTKQFTQTDSGQKKNE